MYIFLYRFPFISIFDFSHLFENEPYNFYMTYSIFDIPLYSDTFRRNKVLSLFYTNYQSVNDFFRRIIKRKGSESFMVVFSLKKHTLTAALNGEIDHHSAMQMRTEIDRAVRETPVSLLILDFSRVTFMDSSGIGLVM